MNIEDKNIIGLRIAIILATMLLIIIMIVGIKNSREKISSPPEIGKKEIPLTPLELRLISPKVKKLGEMESGTEGEVKEIIPEINMEEIPSDRIVEEEITKEEGSENISQEEQALPEKKNLELRPSPEALKKIKRKGLVIY